MAGFEVTALRGYWICEETDGSMLPLLPAPNHISEFLRRSVLAAEVPNRSFCWWLEATPTAGPVDVDKLRGHVDLLIDRLWVDRVNRGADSPGEKTDLGFVVKAGAGGSLFRTGPIPIFAGRVTVVPQGRDVEGLTVRLLAEGGAELAAGKGSVSFTADETHFGVWIDVSADERTQRDVLIERVLVRPEPAA